PDRRIGPVVGGILGNNHAAGDDGAGRVLARAAAQRGAAGVRGREVELDVRGRAGVAVLIELADRRREGRRAVAADREDAVAAAVVEVIGVVVEDAARLLAGRGF